METKFCKYCGEKIPYDAVICNKCGRQVEELKSNSKDSIIVNNNVSTNATAIASSSTRYNRCPKNKWILLALCIFTVCGHKFYEEKNRHWYIIFIYGWNIWNWLYYRYNNSVI